MFRDAWLIAGKDLRVEVRSRVALNHVLPLAVLMLVLFAFALDPDRGVLARATPGLFWVAVLFCGVLAVQRAFAIESADGVVDSLRLSALDPGGLFLGKAAAVAIQLLALEGLLLAGVAVLYDATPQGWPLLVVTCVGATSGIAFATAREFAKRGAFLFLVGRDAAKLSAAAADLRVQGAAEVHTACWEATDLGAIDALVDEAVARLGGLDAVLVAHGVLPDQQRCESDPDALMQALAAFPATPHVLQEFHKGRLFDCAYADETDRVVAMSGRARLSPYYFVAEDKVELGGILATVCSADKKIIHGMEDAIMAPCIEASDTDSAELRIHNS